MTEEQPRINNTGKKAYIILKAWYDSLENDPSAAFGYSPFVATLDSATAEKIARDSPTITKKTHGWASPEGAKLMKIIEVPLL